MQHNQPEFGKGKEISTTSLVPPVLSDYMNYREYLADYYQYKRKATKSSLRQYNYAVFSAAANIKSPNYLKMIIEGKRNLSEDMIGKFGKALGFNKEQTEEFRLLVNFTQATDPADRNIFLKKMSEHRVGVKLKTGEIDRKSFEKVPNWVAWIVYAMVDQEGVSFDTASLKALLRGKASEDEIENSLAALIASGELRRDEKTGEIKKARSLTESPEDIPVALVRKLQSQLMYLGLESIYQDQPTDREFGTLTMSLTKSEFEEIKFKLRQMRKGLNKDNSIARMKTKGERVYQLNIQLFPVTNAVEGVGTHAHSPIVQSALDVHLAESVMEAAAPSAEAVAKAEAVLAQASEAAVAATAAAATAKVQTPVAPVVPAAPAVPVAAKTEVNKAPSNVSSLASAAASAAELFR
ncbi:TIGR02147 family protein [Bdellovibrio sp. KM01]|uniref:TIGR02147 family protein n=1 Tax=Bdellovibrio sp. KM01 TaxID=2748865 RepID=UPI0015E965ED|nr:TIGR02147 family protein [Bdellovibrio sp. KM01]QLY25278.1 TIGR02147 family protein [Bdellovibrio sp. KM01]